MLVFSEGNKQFLCTLTERVQVKFLLLKFIFLPNSPLLTDSSASLANDSVIALCIVLEVCRKCFETRVRASKHPMSEYSMLWTCCDAYTSWFKVCSLDVSIQVAWHVPICYKALIAVIIPPLQLHELYFRPKVRFKVFINSVYNINSCSVNFKDWRGGVTYAASVNNFIIEREYLINFILFCSLQNTHHTGFLKKPESPLLYSPFGKIDSQSISKIPTLRFLKKEV